VVLRVLSIPLSEIDSANDLPKPLCWEVNSEIAASDFLTTSSALGVGDLLLWDEVRAAPCFLVESVPLLKGLNNSETSVITSELFLVIGRGYSYSSFFSMLQGMCEP
jgi:hypothetical protein